MERKKSAPVVGEAKAKIKKTTLFKHKLLIY